MRERNHEKKKLRTEKNMIKWTTIRRKTHTCAGFASFSDVNLADKTENLVSCARI